MYSFSAVGASLIEFTVIATVATSEESIPSNARYVRVSAPLKSVFGM